MRTCSFWRQWNRVFSRVAAPALFVCIPALMRAAQPTVTVTPSSIANNSSTKVTIQISGLNNGDTVRINRYRDSNGNGQIDTGEPLVQSVLVTDGQVAKFGGVTDPKIPGDTDSAVNGAISAKFGIQSQAWTGQLAGAYVIQVVSPTSAFTPVTAVLTITQPSYPQAVSGQITSGGSPVPYAAVMLFSQQGDGGLVNGVVADATGNYSIQAPPGSYAIYSGAPGLLGPAPFSPPALGAGVSLTGQNISLTAATRVIFTQARSVSGSPALPGVQIYVQSGQTGLMAFGAADVTGNLVIPVVAANDWSASADENSLDTIGYLPLQNNSGNFDTTAGNLTLTPSAFGEFTPANAMIYGTLQDSGGNPLSGVDVSDNDAGNVFQDDFGTNSTGSYFLLAAGPGSWQVQPKNDALTTQGYVAPNGVSLTVSSGVAYPVNFVATRPSSFLTGNATENGNPLVGVIIDAQPQNGGSNIQATTGATGDFSLGVSPGTWNVSLDSSTAQQANLIGPQLTETVSSNQTISGLAYPVVPATARVNGTVRDANGNPLSSSYNVDATASINGLQYSVDSNLDGSGGYQLPLINGSWTINVYGPNGSPPGFVQTSLNVTGNQTLNLAPLQATAHFSGTVTQNGSALAGVTMDAQLQNSGNTQFQATTDSGGNFTIGVVAGTWNIFMDGSSVAANNLVVPLLTETISDNQTISGLSYPVVPVTATVSGTAKDANGNPLTSPYNVNASATINSQQYNVSSNLDSGGNYTLPLINGSWNINVYGPNGGPPGFQVVSLNVTGNQTLNLAPLQATAHFSGTVTMNGTVLTGMTIDAQQQNVGGNTQFQGTTDSGGNFTIGVVAGTWNIYMDGSSANANNLVVPMLNETISNNQTISGLSYPVLAATATVSGTVKDANGNPLSSSYYVDASTTINGLQYHASVNLDNNGNYSLPLVNGSWNINVYGPGGQPPGFQQTTVNVTGNRTVNLAPSQDTTPPTLVSSFPANGVTGVPPSSTVAFTFSEPMQSGYSINWTPSVNAGQFTYIWSLDQRTLTCTYNTALPTGATIGFFRKSCGFELMANGG